MDSPLHLGLGSSSGAALYPVAVEVPLIGSEEQRDFIFPSFPSRDDGQSTSPSGPERAAAAVRGALCARSHMSDGATLKDEVSRLHGGRHVGGLCETYMKVSVKSEAGRMELFPPKVRRSGFLVPTFFPVGFHLNTRG